MQKKEVNYYCNRCKSDKYALLNTKSFTTSIKKSPNGLVEVSDIHRCVDGLLTVNNLHVDHNMSVRSYAAIELPQKRQSGFKVQGLPMPGQGKSFTVFNITRLSADGGYRLILTDEKMRIKLRIGEIDLDEKPIETVTTDRGSVYVEYYESSIPFSEKIHMWFKMVIDSIESLPPTRLGLFIEALRYLYRNDDRDPTDFDKRLLDTLLVSHLVMFEIISTDRKLLHNLDKDTIPEKESIQRILDLISEDPDYNLQDIQDVVEEDFTDMIADFIYLEKAGMIEIIFPE